MKIHKYGVVILTEGPVRVEGWHIEREPEDPEGATEEQLVLEFAIPWAQKKLQKAIQAAFLDAFRKARPGLLGRESPHVDQKN